MIQVRSHSLYWLISITLAGALLYWSLRGIEWPRVLQTLGTAQKGEIAACCILMSTTLFLRAIRWRILLLAEGRVSIPLAFWATSAGYFGNNFLPARAGELIRTMMISSRAGLSRMYVLTTALSERMIDAITLVVISASVLLLLPSKPGWLAEAAKPFAVLGFCGVLAIAALPHFEPLYLRVLGWLPLQERLRKKIEHLIANILLGIRSFHNGRRLTGFLALTALIWCLDAATTIVGAQALGLVIPPPVAFLLITGLGLGSALPSTPGYVGVYQFVAVSVLTPFGFQRHDAIAYILLFQALQYFVIGIWGLLAFVQARRRQLAPVELIPANDR